MRIKEETIIKDIKEIERGLYRVKSYSDFSVKVSTLLTLADTYNALTNDKIEIHIPNNKFYLTKLNNSKGYIEYILDEYFDNKKEHNKLAGKILGAFHRSNFNSFELEEGTTKINSKVITELIDAFLIDLDPNMRKEFNYLLMNGLIDSDYKEQDTNITFFNFFKSKPYILIDKLENIFDIDVLMHELGHAYSLKMIENKSYNQSLSFTKQYYEMYSIYVELCFQEFLKKNHIFTKDALILENSFYTYMYTYFKGIKECNDIKDDYTLNTRDMETIKDAFIYSYGHYLAMLLHEKRMDDKEGIEEALNDFLSYQGLLSYDEQLKLFDLNRDKLNDMKVLKKRLKSHNEEISKHIE